MDLRALLQRRRANQAESEDAPPYLCAGVTALAIGILYAVTLSPSTAFWDTSEYIATAHILGIAHPPGNPLFAVLARTWEVLLSPFGLSPAVRINLFSALMGSLAHGMWFLVVHHILGHFSTDRRFRLIAAAAATLVSATAFTVWNQSNVNEKVYTVSLFTIALLSWLAFRWRERLGRGKDDHLIILMAFILALSVGNHLMAFLAAPALAIFIFLVRPATLLNYRLYLFGIPAVVLGLSIHLFLPIRSELGPVINQAAPTCENIGEALTSVVTYGNAGCEDLSAALKREQYPARSLTVRQASISEQYKTWMQYFDWQWSRGLSSDQVLFGRLRTPFTALFIALGIFGALQHYRRDRAGWSYMMALFAVLSVALVFYLNFKPGFSSAPVEIPRDFREVRERDYFFTIGFSVWGLLAGIGIAGLWDWVRRRSGRSLMFGAPVLGLAFIPLVLNFNWASRAGDYSARDWAYNLLMSVEPYGLIFTNGDNDTFPLWYLQEVEGIRRDVTVAVTSYFNIPWYVKQLRDLSSPCEPGEDPDDDPTLIICQRPYSAENTDTMYTHDPAEAEALGKIPILLREPIRVPTRSILDESRFTDETIEQTALQPAPIDTVQAVPLGPISGVIVGQRGLAPWQVFGLWAIRNSIGDRPIYFASSVRAPSELGVRPYVIRQGLAFRLWPGNPAELAGSGVIRNQTVDIYTNVVGPWVDVVRTRTLAYDVFIHRSGLPEWAEWKDKSTIGIPNYYSWVYRALLEHARQTGDEEAIEEYRSRTEAWARLGDDVDEEDEEGQPVDEPG
ncbi:MAG: DUF2723 domain-containing protein [Gemmatimonadetes bacterium]|nr:DUF2723 domain-containing protein [Gemmatimonadota bacterium]MYE71569.1 DUF2723 domain-containing protein [Gemmatimonadota bacterium]MYJ68636.1 DUF2723 domain-containing protein [Gemmatimonadota bacterium]